MQQIGDWLAKLGLAEYAKCFAENRIDFSVLPDLTDQHLVLAERPPGLSNVGVGGIGHRAPLDPNRPSVLRVRADCGGRLFTANPLSAASNARRSTEAHAAAVRSAPRGSGASTVGRVQRFKGAIAQARFTGETKKAAQWFSAIGRLGNRCGMRQDGN
jgi:hypothetical protein